ncbi:MAG: GumC family protein [Candidatus Acidiferrales bacterium]
MENEKFVHRNGSRQAPTSTRDLVAAFFRRRRLMAVSFFGVLLGAILCAIFLPKQYQSNMKILVMKERVDPVVTAQAGNMPQTAREDVTEEDLNSEVELIKSRDLLEKIVADCGLAAKSDSFWRRMLPAEADNVRVARAVEKLASTLQIEPLPKSNLIEVSYTASDPALSARVLETLENEYLAKHLAVHRPAGVFEFFQQQADRYGKELGDAELKLANFSRAQEIASSPVEQEIVLQKWNDFDATLLQTKAAIAETRERIRAIQQQQEKVSPRMDTTDRKADNAQLLQQLKGTLLNLELQRTDLLTKFDPSYPKVREIEQQIAETNAVIAAENTLPLREQTTDRNPTYQWLDDEMSKAKVDLSSLEARAAAVERIVHTYRDKSMFLDQKGIEQEDLTRSVKTEEANYLLYVNKREEARIADALDRDRILNVAIAEAPQVPALPVRSPWFLLFLGGIFAVVISIGSAAVSEYMDPTFRTTVEMQDFLGLRVLAATPEVNGKNGRNGKYGPNGNGHGNGNGKHPVKTTDHSGMGWE